MEKYPKIKFCFDLKTQKRMALEFLRMGWPIHPDLDHLSQYADENLVKQKIASFFENYVQKHCEELSRNFHQAKDSWLPVEESFYRKVDVLLNAHPWPQKSYKAMGSVFYAWPRYIKEGRFAFPISSKYIYQANIVIAHEMLHFIVYDYLEKKFSLTPSERFDRDNKFWQFTENLNALIESGPMWQEFMNGHEAAVKPECRRLYDEMALIWNTNKEVDNLVKQIFHI